MSLDLQESGLEVLDPIEHLRAHPEMYLPYGRVTGPDLMLTVVSEAVQYSGAEVVCRHLEDWWIVASEVDWAARIGAESITDYFRRIFPDPGGGPNAMLGALRLTAFARDVLTFGPDHALVAIQGSVERTDSIRSYAAGHPEWRRIVAFRLEETRSS